MLPMWKKWQFIVYLITQYLNLNEISRLHMSIYKGKLYHTIALDEIMVYQSYFLHYYKPWSITGIISLTYINPSGIIFARFAFPFALVEPFSIEKDVTSKEPLQMEKE